MIDPSEMLGRAGYKTGGRLSSTQRKALPSKDFALPGGRYPINDASHARNALARASQFAEPGQKATIRRKVKAKFPNIKQEKK